MTVKSVFSNNLIIFLIIIAIWVSAFVIYENYKFEKYGKNFTLARNIAFEGDSEGSTSVFEVLYGGKKETVKTSGNYSFQEGRYYFVRILLAPQIEIIDVLPDTVPLCIWKMPIPKTGWKEKPQCQ